MIMAISLINYQSLSLSCSKLSTSRSSLRRHGDVAIEPTSRSLVKSLPFRLIITTLIGYKGSLDQHTRPGLVPTDLR